MHNDRSPQGCPFSSNRREACLRRASPDHFRGLSTMPARQTCTSRSSSTHSTDSTRTASSNGFYRSSDRLSHKLPHSHPPPPLSERPFIDRPKHAHRLLKTPPSFQSTAHLHSFSPETSWYIVASAAATPRSSPGRSDVGASPDHLGHGAVSSPPDYEYDKSYSYRQSQLARTYSRLAAPAPLSPIDSLDSSTTIQEAEDPFSSPMVPRSRWSLSTIDTTSDTSDTSDSADSVTTTDTLVHLSRHDAEPDVDHALGSFLSTDDVVPTDAFVYPERKVRSSKWQNFSYKHKSAPQRPSIKRVDSVEDVMKRRGWKRRGVVFNPSEAMHDDESITNISI